MDNLPRFDDSARALTPLPRGARVAEFAIEQVLGQSAFSYVYLALDASPERRRAIKEFAPSGLCYRGSNDALLPTGSGGASFQEGLENFIQEARILGSIHHPGVVVLETCAEANGTAYMVMDYLPGTMLSDWMRQHPLPNEQWIRSLLTNVLDALRTIHERGIIHRDLKPSNIILVNDNQPVLIDFGAARSYTPNTRNALTAIFTQGYSAPEQWDDTGTLAQGPFTDLYSLGACVYEIVAGRKPMPCNSRLTSRRRDRLPPAMHVGRANYSADLLATIDKALQMDPSYRYQSADEWLKALSDNPESRAHARRRRHTKIGVSIFLVSVLALMIYALVMINEMFKSTPWDTGGVGRGPFGP